MNEKTLARLDRLRAASSPGRRCKRCGSAASSRVECGDYAGAHTGAMVWHTVYACDQHAYEVYEGEHSPVRRWTRL